MTYSVTPSASGTSIKQDGVEVANINASGEWSAKVNGVVQALSNLASIGIGQTWQDLTASRAFGTTYTNTSGRPISVQVQGALNASSIYTLTIDGAVRNRFGAPNLNNQCPISFIVPNGSTYSIAITSGGGSLQLWNELR